MGCCEMVGDYYGDSSVKENLNLLLCLARIETNVDSKAMRDEGSLKGIFKGQGCWGLPQQLLATDGRLGSFKVEGDLQGAHTQK